MIRMTRVKGKRDHDDTHDAGQRDETDPPMMLSDASLLKGLTIYDTGTLILTLVMG